MLRLQHDNTRPHLALALILAGACFATGAASALAASSFDGTYRGTQKTIRTNNSSDCTRIDQENVALTVQDNHFVRHWGSDNVRFDHRSGRDIFLQRGYWRTAQTTRCSNDGEDHRQQPGSRYRHRSLRRPPVVEEVGRNYAGTSAPVRFLEQLPRRTPHHADPRDHREDTPRRQRRMAGKMALLTGIEGVSSRPVRRIVLREG